MRDGLLLLAAMGLVAQYTFNNDLPASLSDIQLPKALSTIQPFALCGGSNGNCVIDGDTIQYQGARVRMVDYDTPEIGEPKCASEEALGHKAKWRLVEILNSGAVVVKASGGRDADQYGRKLRLVTVDGRSVGDTLISEGLARSWEGRRSDWCE